MIPYRIDREARVVELEPVGLTSLDEIDETLLAILNDPAYEPGFGFLRDRRGTQPATTQFLLQGVERMQRVIGIAGTRWAILVDDAANYGMTRMASMVARKLVIQVFDDPTEARLWLRDSLRH